MDRERASMKPLKRKRVFVDPDIGPKEKKNLINGFCDELTKLFEYFHSVLAWKLGQEEAECCSINSAIACMLEGSHLPFSKLSCEIYEKVKESDGVSLGSVQRDLHFIGSRLNYGIDNGNPNLLEDLSESCLWCWEVRDLKLLPKHKRKICQAQRKGREKVRDRVVALSEIVSILRMPESEGNYRNHLSQASEKLGKTLSQEEICSVFEKLAQKSFSEMAGKECNSKEKELLKDIERKMRVAEKEKKKHDRQLNRERCESEREAKRRQIEAEREERRREKEEAELKKQLRRAKEEAEREKKFREKEEAKAKKKNSVQKQATIMERFLKSKKSSNIENEVDEFKSVPSYDSSVNNGSLESTISLMDSRLSQQNNITIEDLRKSHIAAWHGLRHTDDSQRWGVRRKPKAKIFNELKLQGSLCENASLVERENTCNSMRGNETSDPSGSPNIVEEDSGDNRPFDYCDDTAITISQLPRRVRKLLQFDKSHRPPYYGSCAAIKPRRPFAKDSCLDYDVDSDEEWEEEEPGESLSDCDKDEDEMLEEDAKADDEDESDDGFFVPDGYLSENEGVQVDDGLRRDAISDEAQISPSCSPEMENEECSAILQQQKILDRLTQQALRKNQPLIITNLLREESEIAAVKAEQICLQAVKEEVREKLGVSPPPTKGKRGRPKGKRRAPPSGGTVSLPALLAAAAAARSTACEELPKCQENTQPPIS
ncbi:unnamed protein product [Spirodela intermedia]|uniref:Chromatin assembly factor 1 subunit A dimerization domain-containing protein n=1 Tax=Spirodela intermedia TaxID=51605 RepID=A0A7I8KTF2_SPIIN|nr:unnamed protein product [Spirodela intermedia]